MLVLDIVLIILVASIVTSLPGVILYLRQLPLMSDALSHSLVFGIAIMFLLTNTLDSSIMLIGACGTALLLAGAVEILIDKAHLNRDAALALMFPLFFSTGVIIISRYARNVHLDIDMVILGELVFAPFRRMCIGGYDVGPWSLWCMSLLGIIFTIFLMSSFSKLVHAMFDEQHASILGLRPRVLYYASMALTSLIIVAAFDCFGSIVVIALMIVPSSTAYLLAQSVTQMFYLTAGFAAMAGILGYIMAAYCAVSIAGSIAVMTGILLSLVYLWAPNGGLCAYLMQTSKKRKALDRAILKKYMDNAEPSVTENIIARDLNWPLARVQNALKH